MSSGTFKECEAYSVCGRMGNDFDKVLVVASAGNTARAFARVCSDNSIPLLLFVPQDNLDALWFHRPISDDVRVICPESGGDYFDAIRMSQVLTAGSQKFIAEGGAANIARRDGMATTILSAAHAVGFTFLESTATHQSAFFGPPTAEGNPKIVQTQFLCQTLTTIAKRRGGAA